MSTYLNDWNFFSAVYWLLQMYTPWHSEYFSLYLFQTVIEKLYKNKYEFSKLRNTASLMSLLSINKTQRELIMYCCWVSGREQKYSIYNVILSYHNHYTLIIFNLYIIYPSLYKQAQAVWLQIPILNHLPFLLTIYFYFNILYILYSFSLSLSSASKHIYTHYPALYCCLCCSNTYMITHTNSCVQKPPPSVLQSFLLCLSVCACVCVYLCHCTDWVFGLFKIKKKSGGVVVACVCVRPVPVFYLNGWTPKNSIWGW